MSTSYRSKWPALIGICLLAFTAFLDFTIVNTALPFIQKAFNTNILKLQWIANIFPIILGMTMIAVGKIGDFLGRKRTFYVGVILFGTSAFFAGICTEINWLIFFRGLQAFGASITFVVSSALTSEVFKEQQRPWAIGIYGGITGLGLMLGPLFGGILVGALDWRWVFWINIPLIAIGLLLCLLSLKGASKREQQSKLDYKGLMLLIFGLGLIMYTIIAGADQGFSSDIWIMLVIGALALALLLKIELKSKDPMLSLFIFKDPLLLLAVISCAIAGVVSYVFMFFDPLFLKNILDLSPYTIGLLVAIIPLAQIVISFAFRHVLKIGLANLLLISSITPLIAAFFHLFFGPHSSLATFIIPFALLGVNWGLSNTAMITAVNENVAAQKIGQSIGTITTIWNIAGAILLALSSLIFHLRQTTFLPAFKTVILFNLLFLLIVVLIAFFVRKKISKTKAE